MGWGMEHVGKRIEASWQISLHKWKIFCMEDYIICGPKTCENNQTNYTKSYFHITTHNARLHIPLSILNKNNIHNQTKDLSAFFFFFSAYLSLSSDNFFCLFNRLNIERWLSMRLDMWSTFSANFLETKGS